jgi:hypothetical protein
MRISAISMLRLPEKLPNTALSGSFVTCTPERAPGGSAARSPAARHRTNRAGNAGASVVGCYAARFQAACVVWSWFHQSGIISSRPPALTSVLREGASATGNANR